MKIILVSLVLFIGGCRCAYISNGSLTACGCSLLSDTIIMDIMIDPCSITTGIYRGASDDISVKTVYGTLETK